ncbi:MAG: hypothetical protein CFE23_10830 [Flavobacterium sp. BFFFF1]|nr:MAG: hypothetical protein CFE23_10830 [Flavobacterium sp. BFFFF1]
MTLVFFYSCTEKDSRKETEIDLSSKRLTTIPDSVFEYKNLIKLKLGAKEVVFYPPLSALPESDKEKNQISELPEKISELILLKVLILNSNSLKSLPNEISKLKNLEVLDLALNKNLNIVAEIPKLKLLPNLKVLKITDAKFNKVDLEIIQKSLGSKVRIVSSATEYMESYTE